MARDGSRTSPWLPGMLARKPGVLVTVALANKMARIFWARMALGRNLQSSGRGGLVRVSGVGEAERSSERSGAKVRRQGPENQ